MFRPMSARIAAALDADDVKPLTMSPRFMVAALCVLGLLTCVAHGGRIAPVPLSPSRYLPADLSVADLSVRKGGFRSVLHQGNKPKTATLFVVPTNTFPFAIVGATNLL